MTALARGVTDVGTGVTVVAGRRTVVAGFVAPVVPDVATERVTLSLHTNI